MLGHLTTSGGHAVSCAASLAGLKILTTTSLLQDVNKKEKLFRSQLLHPSFKEIRGKGLLLAIEFDNEMTTQKIITRCFEKGLLTDWFLFAPSCMRIAPPLIISEEEIRTACETIVACADNL